MNSMLQRSDAAAFHGFPKRKSGGQGIKNILRVQRGSLFSPVRSVLAFIVRANGRLSFPVRGAKDEAMNKWTQIRKLPAVFAAAGTLLWSQSSSTAVIATGVSAIITNQASLSDAAPVALNPKAASKAKIVASEQRQPPTQAKARISVEAVPNSVVSVTFNNGPMALIGQDGATGPTIGSISMDNPYARQNGSSPEKWTLRMPQTGKTNLTVGGEIKGADAAQPGEYRGYFEVILNFE